MALDAIEVIALVFVLFALVKIIVILFSKKIWYNNVVKPIYKNSNVIIVFVILSLLILYYLLKELSLTQIFAVMALSSLLIGIGFMQHSKELLPVFEKLYNKKFYFWHWIYIIFWVILLILTLFEIF